MAKDEVSLKDVFEVKDGRAALTQRLGARAMPIEGKRKLAAVGNAMDAELSGTLTGYLESLDESLGRSAAGLGEQDAVSDEPAAPHGGYL